MMHRKLADMTGGGLVGHFEPTCFKTTVTVVVKLPSVANDMYPIAEGEAAPFAGEFSQ